MLIIVYSKSIQVLTPLIQYVKAERRKQSKICSLLSSTLTLTSLDIVPTPSTTYHPLIQAEAQPTSSDLLHLVKFSCTFHKFIHIDQI